MGFYSIAALLALALVALVATLRVGRTRERELQNHVRDLRRQLGQERLAKQQADEERMRESAEQQQRIEENDRRIQDLTVDRLSFFTNITHEFRTPITLILGPIHKALQINTNDKITDQLHMAERNAHYLLALVNQLMDFRKIESGKMELHRQTADFEKFVNEAVDAFRPMTDERGISMEVLCHLPRPVLSIDKEALLKLLNNFLSNAVKYTPDGGEITVRAAMLPGDGNPKLYLSVSDSGDGIAAEDLDKIFDRFYQGKSSLKYPSWAGSSGIGLYLCKSIVEAYGGTLTAKNNHGRGCAFRVLLPMPTEEEAVEATETMPVVAVAPEADVDSRDAGPMTVLVVEDNADMRRYVADILADKYRVDEAPDGREAMQILMSRPIDFIITDLMMPQVDGLELARKVKENLSISHIPIIMLTAKTSDVSKLEGFNSGIDDYIEKPFSPELLMARIDNIVKNKKRYQRQFTSDFKVEPLPPEEETRDQKFMREVMEVVKGNYKNSYFDVGDFAESLGVSRSFLNKKLQSLTGMSAGQIVRTYRLRMARELIARNRVTRTMTIAEIAYDVGFNDSKYFTRCFTKEFNVTPSAFMAGEGEP